MLISTHTPCLLPQAVLPWGVGFHNAAMEAEDRALIEGLFRDGALMVLVRARDGAPAPFPMLGRALQARYQLSCLAGRSHGSARA